MAESFSIGFGSPSRLSINFDFWPQELPLGLSFFEDDGLLCFDFAVLRVLSCFVEEGGDVVSCGSGSDETASVDLQHIRIGHLNNHNMCLRAVGVPAPSSVLVSWTHL